MKVLFGAEKVPCSGVSENARMIRRPIRFQESFTRHNRGGASAFGQRKRQIKAISMSSCRPV